MPLERVFPLSARDALAARVDLDPKRLAASRLPPLEDALAAQLMPRRQELLVQSAVGVVEQLRQCIRLNLDCADVCAATGAVASRRTGSNESVIKRLWAMELLTPEQDRAITRAWTSIKAG